MGDIRSLYFENYVHPAAGHLIQAGIATPGRINDWCDIRDLRAFPYYNLSMILAPGTGAFRNEAGFSCQLSFGNFILLTPGEKQYYGPGKNEYWSELCVSFNGDLFKVLRKHRIIRSDQPVWQLAEPSLWVEKLKSLLSAPRPHSEQSTVREASVFSVFLLEMLENAMPVNSGNASSDWFQNACVMLTADLSQKINLPQIAQNLGMSYHTFRTYFAQRAGQSPMAYRNEQRIHAACDFLTNTTASCRDIAFRIGYATEQRFSAGFKRVKGMPPGKYRNSHNSQK